MLGVCFSTIDRSGPGALSAAPLTSRLRLGLATHGAQVSDVRTLAVPTYVWRAAAHVAADNLGVRVVTGTIPGDVVWAVVVPDQAA